MTRINVYDTDEFGDPGAELAGWFDVDRAEGWTDKSWDRTGHGTGLYRTAKGRWVFDNEAGRCTYIKPDVAREWLLANSKDEAVTKHFGPIEEERGPGRPSIGEQVCFTIPAGDLACIDSIAERDKIARSAVLRKAVAEFVLSEQPYTVTFRDISNGQREVDSRHGTCGTAVERLRELQAYYEDRRQNQGLPGGDPRVELDGRPVDVEAYGS